MDSSPSVLYAPLGFDLFRGEFSICDEYPGVAASTARTGSLQNT